MPPSENPTPAGAAVASVDAAAPTDVLARWFARQAAPAAQAWLAEQRRQVAAGDKNALYLGFGLAPRKVGKDDVRLDADDERAAARARPDWRPVGWSVDQAARALLVLAWPAPPEPAPTEPATSDDAHLRDYVAVLDKLFATGEVRELTALYQTLPLLPHPAAHVARAAEGVRSNMKAVFAAVAHHNPYPAEWFDEGAWNQMTLKCLFVGLPLDPVIGLDRRANPALARMLVDYAHERWAAKRVVSPELWRPVGRHADDRGLAALLRVLAGGDPLERQAAALALAQCPRPEAAALRRQAPDLAEAAAQGKLSWRQIAAAWRPPG